MMKNVLKVFILIVAFSILGSAASNAKLKALVYEFINDKEGAAIFAWGEIEKAQKAGEFAVLEFSKQSGFVFSISTELGRENAKKALAETGAELIVWGRIEGTITMIGISWRGRQAQDSQAFEGAPVTQFLFFFKDHDLKTSSDVLIQTLKAFNRYIARDYEQSRAILEKLFETSDQNFSLDDVSLLRGWCWIKKYSGSLDPNDFDMAKRALLLPFKRIKERENPLLAGSLKASLSYLYLLRSACDPKSPADLKDSAKSLAGQAIDLFKVANMQQLEAEANNLIKSQLACPQQGEPTNKSPESQ